MPKKKEPAPTVALLEDQVTQATAEALVELRVLVEAQELEGILVEAVDLLASLEEAVVLEAILVVAVVPQATLVEIKDLLEAVDL